MKNEMSEITRKGVEQLKAIMNEIIEIQGYPNFDYIYGVLSCKKVLGELTLWFWFGELLIVKPGQTRAKQMQRLSDWNTEEDGTITLIGVDKK